MVAGTEATRKVLLVGKKRICQQVAYVLDCKDYDQLEKLTKQGYDLHHDDQIYVCEFRCKSRKLVERAVFRTASNIQYFDEIFHALDAAYYAKRKRRENKMKHIEAVAATAIEIEQTVSGANQLPVLGEPTQPLWRRIRRGLKHPWRAAGHVVLRIKETIKQRYIVLRQKHEVSKQITNMYRCALRESRAYYKRQCAHQKKMRNNAQHGNLKYLRQMPPSRLLWYVLQAPINRHVQCDRIETELRVEKNGEISGCCSVRVAFGNLMTDGELDEIYHSTYARIVKLSSLNRSYCLCDFNRWCKGYCSSNTQLPEQQWQTQKYPTYIFMSFDRTCNLCCRGCRTEPYRMDDAARQVADEIVAKLLRSGWLEQVPCLKLAGSGETFYSPYYRQLLTTDLKRQRIDIKSNGTLFNESNWQLIANKYQTINVDISVDAATAETYQKLRGADFENLMKNLTMLGDLRRRNHIGWLRLNFVVQRDNFREMKAFVQLGRALGVDCIQFQRLNNLGSFTKQECLDHCLIIDNTYLDYKLWCVLQDPIFKDPMVDLRILQRYIDASERRYRQRYQREQRQSA